MSHSSSLSEPRNFRCETSTEAGDPATVRVIAIGELDMVSAPLLSAELSAVQEGAELVVLDLSRLTFMDSTGLQLVITTQNRLLENGRRLKLVRGISQVQRLFELTGLEAGFEFVSAHTDPPGT